MDMSVSLDLLKGFKSKNDIYIQGELMKERPKR